MRQAMRSAASGSSAMACRSGKGTSVPMTAAVWRRCFLGWQAIDARGQDRLHGGGHLKLVEGFGEER